MSLQNRITRNASSAYVNVCFRWKRHRRYSDDHIPIIVVRTNFARFRTWQTINDSLHTIRYKRVTIETDTGYTCRVRRNVSKVRVETDTNRFARGFSKSYKTIDRLLKAKHATEEGCRTTNKKRTSYSVGVCVMRGREKITE